MSQLFKKESTVRFAGLFLFLFAAFVFASGVLTIDHFSPTVYAQEEGEAAAAPAAAPAANASTEDVSEGGGGSVLMWYLTALGPFAPVFGIISVLFVMLVVMNWMAINRNSIMPLEMIEAFKTHLDEEDFQAAYESAKESESPQGKVLAAGLAKMASGYAAAEQSMSDVAEEEIMRMEQKLGYIATIASISPMVGLLGTVFGMVASFYVIASSPTTPQASELAAGISTALITTQIGLIIAIPAIIIYEFFRNKLALLVLEMTVQTENLMNRFKTA